jgi:quercetin dioxygenase-like cupin family protein
MFAMKRVHVLPIAALFLGLAILAPSHSTTLAQDEQPIDLPCVTGVTAQTLGVGMPESANGQALVLLHLTVAPAGGFAPHTHPGMMVVSVESGTIDVTQIGDMEMTVTRAASNGTPGATEPLTNGMTATLHPGDSFVEPAGMVHTAFNNGSDPATLMATGLIDPNQPATQCVDGTPTS